MVYYQDMDLTIRSMEPEDCQAFAQGFAAQGWNKPLSQFERYLEEQTEGLRQVLVAVWQGEQAGYTTLLPKAPAGAFAEKDWPEVCDFNVLEKFQRRGIGNRILQVAEELAGQVSDTVCLGVGLYRGYGAAQRLYVKRGYLPDGTGVWYQDKQMEHFGPCAADDDLVLYLYKRLERQEFRLLCREELVPELFRWFDRFQPVERCWRREDQGWVVKDIPFTERWSQEEYQVLCDCLQRTTVSQGSVWGAFVEGRLKGFASVEGERIGSRRQYADLTSIHVSADARGRGLGRKLFLLAAEAGRELGAESLYISAHSSVESQAFYKAMGCVEAREYSPAHVAQEPCDCQLEYPLPERERTP